MTTLPLGTVVAFSCVLAQDPGSVPSGSSAKPLAYRIPIPFIDVTSLPPEYPGHEIPALSKKQKAMSALDRTVGPRALANRALLAGYSQWRDRPEEWPGGMEGYGRRFGYRMTRLAVRNGVMLTGDLLMGTDQRYDRCACSGFLLRTGHAFRRVLVARTDSGGETINLPRIAGGYAGAAVSYQLYPARYHSFSAIMSSGSEYLLWRGATNILREFWPEIRRAIRIGPRPDSGR